MPSIHKVEHVNIILYVECFKRVKEIKKKKKQNHLNCMYIHTVTEKSLHSLLYFFYTQFCVPTLLIVTAPKQAVTL